MVFLSNYLVFKIVLAALGRVDYPVAGDLELKYDTANKIYLSGGSLDYVDDYTLYTTIGGETTTHIIPQSPRIDFNNETKLTGEATGNFGSSVSIDGDYLAITDSYYHSNDYGKVYIYHRSGTTWSLQNSFQSATSSDYMNAVALSGNYVMAGVRYGDNAGSNAGEVLVYKRSGTTWTNTQTLTASDATAGDHFGFSVTSKGNYAVVGTGQVSGAYVFTLSNGTWSETQLLTTGTDSDLFGCFVKLSDTDLLIGARGVNSLKGTAYIYTNNGGTFTQQAQITPDDLVGTDWFGQNGDIFGDYACVGAPYQNSDTGAAYIFKRSGTSWTQQQKLTASNSSTTAKFGGNNGINFISDDTLIIGASYDNAKGADAGAAYLFQRTGDTWSEIKIIYPSDIGANDFFGRSISSSETDLVISGPTQDDATGNVYLFPYTKTRNFYITDAGKYSVDATIAGLKYKTNEVEVTGTPTSSKVTQVATGGNVSLALTQDGFVYAWGEDTYGQMGQGTTDTNVNTPVKVKGVGGSGFLSNITKITVGGTFCMALASDGTLYTWGQNNHNQLGDGTTTERKTPVTVSYSGDPISNISAGMYHSAFTTTTGKVYAFGRNNQGQVGDNTSGTNRSTPTQVVGVGNSGTLTGIRDVSCGDDFTHAIKDSDGSVYGWGKQLYGMIGNGQNSGDATTPTPVILASDSSAVTGITQISGGGDSALMLKSGGTVYACGYNGLGQIGNGTITDADDGLVQVLGVGGSGNLTGITQIAIAYASSLALKSDGTMYSWGNNNDGQNGLGTVGGTNPTTPVAITLLTGVDTINTGGKPSHFIVTKPDGSVFCWGRGDEGQIGDGTNTAEQGTPTQVLAGAGPSVDGKFNLLTEPRLTFDGYNKLSLLHGLSSVSSKLFFGSNVYDIGTLTSDLTIETPGLYKGLVFDTSSNVAYFNKTTVGAIGTTMAGYEADTIIYGTVQSGASHGNSQGGFGNNTILNADGTRLLVTDPLNYPSGRGRAYIYHLESGSWVLKQTWDNPNNSGQRFSDGACMNEDGTRVFLMHSESEKVYTYEYASGAWPTANTGTHTISPGTIGSLCLNLSCNKTGDVLLIVHGRSQTSKIYRRASATSWSQDSGGSFSSMGDGGCINGDGTRAFLGRESDSTIHMTEWNGSTWSSLTQIINETDTTFPAAMACDSAGDTLVVKAATLADIDKSGIYERDSGTGSWSRTQDINGSTEIYGTTQPSISYDGTMVLVGSHHYDTKRGRAYLWQKSGGSWSLTKTYENPDASPASNDYWGSGTGIARTSKGTFVIGFQSDDTAGTDYGSVHIYTNAIPDFISFDTYNKLSLSGITNPTSKIHALPTGAESTTVYDIGSATNIYIDSAGTYTAEMKGATKFALDSTVVSGDITPDLSLSETSIAKQFIYDENGYTDAMFSEASETQCIRLSSDGLAMALGDGNYNSNDGRLYYYERSSISDTFTKTHTFDAVSSGLEFGASVDMNAAKTRIAISGSDADNSAANAGRVYIYDRASTSASWPSSPTATITPPASTIKRFGHTVNMSDDGLTMITSGDGIDSTANRSGVYVYEYSGGSWTKTFQVTQGIARFGFKVAMNKTGTRFIAGGTNTAYYVYHKESGTWNSTAALTGATGNHCGMSPDGNTVAVGIIGYSSNLGRVAVYKYSGSSWGSVVNIDTTVGSGIYQIGNTPVFNNDGTLLVTGCSAYNSYMGCFEMWKYESGSWVFKKQFLNPTVKTGHGTDTGEFFGGYLSMDYAGTSVIVSNTGNDVAGADYGRVVLYGAGSPPSLNFDTYNKLTFTGADTDSTYKLKYESNTYDLGTISNVYIAYPGTYSAEIKGATNFALSSNVATIQTVTQPTLVSSISITTSNAGWGSYTYEHQSTNTSSTYYEYKISADPTNSVYFIAYNWTTNKWYDTNPGTTHSTFGTSVSDTSSTSRETTENPAVVYVMASNALHAQFINPYFLGPSLDFDTYNKLTFTGLESGSTSNVTFDGNTYSIGTASNVYISEQGTYEAESKGTTTFALTKNVVGDTPTQKTLLTPGLINTFDGNADSEEFGKCWNGIGGTLSMNSSGTLAVISAVTYSSSTGRVYLYEKGSDNTWSLKFTFTSPRSTGDQFGHDIAINSDGTRIFILSGRYNVSGHGRIHIYDGPTWSTTPTTTLEEPSGQNGFWARMSINSTGTKVAATGVLYPNTTDGDGRVYIFTHDGTNWGTTAATLDNPSSGTGGEFGYATQMNTDGTRMLIGETVNDEGGASIGRAYAYALESGTWTLKQDLAGHSVNEQFGTRISMTPSGSRAVICAPYNDETVVDGGRVYIYDYDSSAGTWSHIQDISAISNSSTGGNFGFDARINDSGTRILIGAPTVDDDGTNRGRAYVFDRQSDGTWTLTKTLNDSGQDSSEFGRSVGMDSTGNIMLIAAPKDDQAGTDRGRIYYYQGSGGSPSLTHDGYKLVVKNITPTSTTLKYDSNTYEIGTATNIYVENTGDYSAEIGNATDFALTNTTVSGTIKTIEPGFASRYQGSMALTYDGKLYAWGMNDDGEAGVGTSSDITVPTLCTGITQGTVAKLLSGSDITENSRGEVSAIKTTDGKIYMAGKGDNNCIPGETSDQTSFTDVTSYFGDQSLTANTVTMMSFTDESGAALTETGNVWTWGTHDSTYKKLGQAGASSSSTPKQINFSSATGTITKVTCGHYHTVALDSSGDVWFWGKNGINSTSWPSSITDEPQKVVDGKNIIGLSQSYGTMYAWDATGKMWNAGNNYEGQIGDGTTTASSTGKTLTEVTYFSSKGITINKVYGGGYFVFADTSDGYYCWGAGTHGVFGNGSTGDITSGPAKWTNVSNIKKFMASTQHTTAITEDGKYYAWGRDYHGGRGDSDSSSDITYPKYIDTLPNILAPSFEFDGYDKVFVKLGYEEPPSLSSPRAIGDWINCLGNPFTFDGTTYTLLRTGGSMKYTSDISTGAVWTYCNSPGGKNLTSDTVKRIAGGTWEKGPTGNRPSVNSNIVENDNVLFIKHGSPIEPTYAFNDPYDVTPPSISEDNVKFSKNAIEYDVGKASIITVPDPGTYDAQISQGSVFSLKSETVPATKTSGLYTWAFHHGNFDNAYGDGDILTARENGRFYADTPAYTGDIGTITPVNPFGTTQPTLVSSLTITNGKALNTLSYSSYVHRSTDTTNTRYVYALGTLSEDTKYDIAYNWVTKKWLDIDSDATHNTFGTSASDTTNTSRISTENPQTVYVMETYWNLLFAIFTNPYYQESVSSTTYTFTPASTLTANVMMVAGGGGGGGRAAGGGGGAGGLVYTAGTSLAENVTKTIVVGNGDSGGYGEVAQNGYDGKDTTFTGLTTADGGGGGGNSSSGTGVAGGSGGGGGGSGSGGAAASGSQGTAGGASSSASYGGGGGGAGAAGSDYSGDYAGDGGTGKFFGTGSSFTDFGDEYGEGGYFAGGGAGGSNGAAGKFGGTPGRGGGGYGGNYYGYMGIQDEQHGGSQHALPHTGSGGGGTGSVTRDQHPGYDAVGNGGVKGHGGRGGSGIVLIQTNVALPNGSNTAVVQVGNPRRRSLPPAVSYMGSEVNRFYIIDGASMPTYKLPTHWYADPISSNSDRKNDDSSSKGQYTIQTRADGGTSNVWYASAHDPIYLHCSMMQTLDSIFMPVEKYVRYDMLLKGGGNDANDIQLDMGSDGKAKLYRNNNGTLISSSTEVCFTVGKWHHIALTIDSGGNAVGYVNGYPVVTGTHTSTTALGSRNVSTFYRCGDASYGVTFRKHLTYECSTYNFHMSPKQVLQRAAEVGCGPKLEYDGLNTIKILNTEPGSSVKLFTSNVADTSNVFIVADPAAGEYTVPEAGKYYAEIKGTDTFTVTKTIDVSGTFPLYQYPPIDGTTSSLTPATAANLFNNIWTISGAASGNGQYQVRCNTAADNNHYNAWRNNVGSTEQWQTAADPTYPITFTILLPSAKTIRKYRMFPLDHVNPNGSGTTATPGTSIDPTLPGNGGDDATKRPKSWVIRGSNNDSVWTDLDTVTNKPISIYGDVYSIDSPASYQYYQLSVTANNGGNKLLLGDIQLWGDA